jgi:hypothetical protein
MGFINHLITGGHHPVYTNDWNIIYMGDVNMKTDDYKIGYIRFHGD